jgi:hypothetical protein
MKNIFKLIGIIALVAVIGFSMAACGGGDDGNGNGNGNQGTAPTITTASLPNGTVGTAYSQTLAATGDTPIIWSIESGGTLPEGLGINGYTGVISGTPSIAATSTFTVKATNDKGSNTKQLSITIAAGSSGGSGNGEPTAWTAVNVSNLFDDTFNNITGIAYGNNKFVAGGSVGKMAYSTDGITWQAVGDSKFGTNNILVVAYINNKFFAGGQNGKMAYSSDGITWEAIGDSTFGTGAFNGINTIAYGNNKYVAGGQSGKMATSSDGITWQTASSSIFGTDNINAIVFYNGKFFALSANGNGVMATSTDGANWTRVTDNKIDSPIYGIAYGNGKYVAVGLNGKMEYSSDGVSWTLIPAGTGAGTSNVGTSGSLFAIAYGNNKFVAVGFAGVMNYSSDGITWTAVTNNTFDVRINSIAWGNNKFVVVGLNGKMAYSSGN